MLLYTSFTLNPFTSNFLEALSIKHKHIHFLYFYNAPPLLSRSIMKKCTTYPTGTTHHLSFLLKVQDFETLIIEYISDISDDIYYYHMKDLENIISQYFREAKKLTKVKNIYLITNKGHEIYHYLINNTKLSFYSKVKLGILDCKALTLPNLNYTLYSNQITFMLDQLTHAESQKISNNIYLMNEFLNTKNLIDYNDQFYR